MIAASASSSGGVEPPLSRVLLASLGTSRNRAVFCIDRDAVGIAGWGPPGAIAAEVGRAGTWFAAFDGWMGNREDLCHRLALVDSSSDNTIYAHALARWGERADELVRGQYAAIAAREGEPRLRIARSPYFAPPLHHRSHGGAIIASSLIATLELLPGAPSLSLDHRQMMDSLAGDHSDASRGWYRGTGRAPLGRTVWLNTDGRSETVWAHRFAPDHRLARAPDDEIVERALYLLDEAVKGAAHGCARPAVSLSGGLDSALVAASLLRSEAHDRVDSYTIAPEAGWRAPLRPGHVGDESEAIARFAAQYPQLRPHTLRNPGGDFRDRLDDVLDKARCAPTPIGLGGFIEQVAGQARADGCDVVLGGDEGNSGISASGEWAYREFFTRGRWRELYLALKHRSRDPRPMWRKFASLVIAPSLRGQGTADHAPEWYFRARGLNLDAVERVGLAESSALRHVARGRASAPTMAQTVTAMAEKGDFGVAELRKAVEALHGLPYRDPTAYPPLLDFCFSLPSTQFLRGGEDRHLARRMARGRLPESQRLSRAFGVTQADWHLRIGRIRGELIDEFTRMTDDPDITEWLDPEGIAQQLRKFPETPTGDVPETMFYTYGMPAALAAARQIARAKGRNDL